MSGIIGTSSSKSKVIGRSLDTAHAWCHGGTTGGTPAITKGFNMDDITDNGVGDYTCAWRTNLPNGYPCVSMAGDVGGYGTGDMQPFSVSASSIRLRFWNKSGGDADPTVWHMICFGGNE
jgi:hypothetical protein